MQDECTSLLLMYFFFYFIVVEQLDESAVKAEAQINSASLPQPLTAIAQRDLMQPQFAAALIFEKVTVTCGHVCTSKQQTRKHPHIYSRKR